MKLKKFISRNWLSVGLLWLFPVLMGVGLFVFEGNRYWFFLCSVIMGFLFFRNRHIALKSKLTHGEVLVVCVVMPIWVWVVFVFTKVIFKGGS